MGILDDLLQAIPEEKEPATPPPAAKETVKEPEKKEDKENWYSDAFKKYANIS